MITLLPYVATFVIGTEVIFALWALTVGLVRV